MLIDLDGQRRARSHPVAGSGATDDQHLLHEVALALNSTLELREVLHRLAELALQATGADRCSLFLLDGNVLEPAVAIGRVPDEDLWAAFQEMGPVDLCELPAVATRLGAGQHVAIEDAPGSGLLPQAWVERFGLRSLVLVSLIVADEAVGTMAVDYQHRRKFEEDELELLESLGAYAGVAVRNARLFEDTRRRARLQEAVARGATALAAPTEVTNVVSAVVDAFTDLPGAGACAIALFDDAYHRITLLAAPGTGRPSGPVPVSSVPEHLVRSISEAWQERPRPVAFTDEPWLVAVTGEAVGRHHLVLPLVVDERVGGAVLLSFSARPGQEERAAARTLATIAAATFEHTSMLERLASHGRRFEALYALSSSLVEGADATAVTARLNGLLANQGIEVVGMTFRDRRLARLLATPPPTREDRAAMSRRAAPGSDRLPDGSLAIPMRVDRKVVGVLRVHPADIGDEERSFLETLGRGVAEVASRGALRAALDEAARERAVTDERDRLAADLHDTAGQIFVAIGLLARRCLEHLPADSPWHDRFARVAELADGGKWELEQSIRALAFVPASRRGLASSLRDLSRSVASDSGIQVLVDITGSPLRLDPAVERALYRVANEALSNAWRHARCAVIRLELTYHRDEVVLRVHDDGVGLPGTVGEPDGGHGVANMRRALSEVGGSLRLRNGKPRGVAVEARVKAGRA